MRYIDQADTFVSPLSAFTLDQRMAIRDFARHLDSQLAYVPPPNTNVGGTGSESSVQASVRLEAARRGDMYLWRNNVGAGKLENGSFVRWGLANDSAALNKRIKSADLIGIEQVLITEPMVGTIIGRFVSRECKRADWLYTPTPENKAQVRWHQLIESMGGNSAIVTGPGSL